MKTILTVCAAVLLASYAASCSVYLEATRPTPVDLSQFQDGMSRDAVLEKVGAPDSTAVESDGTSCDFYKLYTRGYGAGGKIPIAVAEGTADVFTLGLAEIVLTPTEGVTQNEKHPVTICYKDQKLARITGEGQPQVASDQNPPVTAASSATSDVKPIAPSSPSTNTIQNPAVTAASTTTSDAKPIATSSPAAGTAPPAVAAVTSLPAQPAQQGTSLVPAKAVAAPDVGDQWKSSDHDE